jgi:hypothetical protein
MRSPSFALAAPVLRQSQLMAHLARFVNDRSVGNVVGSGIRRQSDLPW